MEKNFDLNKMGLVPLTENELIQVDGGSFWGEVLRQIGVETLIGGAKMLAKKVIDDWNSRSGSQNSMINIYSTNPYH
jgi:hypothetical protein